MAINGKTLTAVEALVTATDTSEGDFRTGMDDVLLQVDTNQVASADAVSEQAREYLRIRALRAGNWDYLTAEDTGATAANRLAYFGGTVSERAGRYRFVVVGGGGGGTSGHGGGAGGMYAFDYIWNGTEALDWDIDGSTSNTQTGETTTLTLPSGYVATALGGENGNVNSNGISGQGGLTTLSATADTNVSNVLRRQGGRGTTQGTGRAGGGAVNVLGLLPDDGTATAASSTDPARAGGNVWGPRLNQLGLQMINLQGIARPPGLWMGNMTASPSPQSIQNTTNGSSLGPNANTIVTAVFFGGGAGEINNRFHTPGLFGGWGYNSTATSSQQQNMAQYTPGGGGGGSGTSRGSAGVIAWCRMGPS